jgi:hypothetical protein
MSEAAIVVDDTLEDEVVEDQIEIESEEEETAEEAPVEPPKVQFSEEQQAIFNKEIGNKVAKHREAERHLEEERLRREAVEKKLAEYEKVSRPNIPDIPDPYDDNFAEKTRQRDQVIAEAARFDAGLQSAEEQSQRDKQAAFEKQQEQTRLAVQTYSTRAESLGIKPADLQTAGNQVHAFGIAEEVSQHILSDEQGPAITMYLSTNPVEMEAVRNMNPMQAAVYIETQVKTKAVAARTRVTTAPAPIETITGAGFPSNKDLPGATFE